VFLWKDNAYGESRDNDALHVCNAGLNSEQDLYLLALAEKPALHVLTQKKKSMQKLSEKKSTDSAVEAAAASEVSNSIAARLNGPTTPSTRRPGDKFHCECEAVEGHITYRRVGVLRDGGYLRCVARPPAVVAEWSLLCFEVRRRPNPFSFLSSFRSHSTTPSTIPSHPRGLPLSYFQFSQIPVNTGSTEVHVCQAACRPRDCASILAFCLLYIGLDGHRPNLI